MGAVKMSRATDWQTIGVPRKFQWNSKCQWEGRGGGGWGGVDQFSRKITNFRDCLENMGLTDLGYIGSWFT